MSQSLTKSLFISLSDLIPSHRPAEVVGKKVTTDQRILARQDAAGILDAMERVRQSWKRHTNRRLDDELVVQVLRAMSKFHLRVLAGAEDGSSSRGHPTALTAVQRLAEAMEAYTRFIGLGISTEEEGVAALSQSIRTQAAALTALADRGDEGAAAQATFAAVEIKAQLTRVSRAGTGIRRPLWPG